MFKYIVFLIQQYSELVFEISSQPKHDPKQLKLNPKLTRARKKKTRTKSDLQRKIFSVHPKRSSGRVWVKSGYPTRWRTLV